MAQHSRNFSADGASSNAALLNLNKQIDDFLHSRPDVKVIAVSFNFTQGSAIQAHAILIFETAKKTG